MIIKDSDVCFVKRNTIETYTHTYIFERSKFLQFSPIVGIPKSIFYYMRSILECSISLSTKEKF